MKRLVFVSHRCSLRLAPSSPQQHNVFHPFAALHFCLRATGYFFPWITCYILAHLRFGGTCQRTGMRAKLTSFAQRSYLHALLVRQSSRMGHKPSR